MMDLFFHSAMNRLHAGCRGWIPRVRGNKILMVNGNEKQFALRVNFLTIKGNATSGIDRARTPGMELEASLSVVSLK